MDDIVISVRNVSMRFNLAKEKTDTLKETVIKKLTKQLDYDEFYALKNIFLEIKRGEAVALIGRNGCGKSTLLKVVSGVYSPSLGSISINGTLAPLIELGAGFDTDLTARENVYLNGAVLGHDRYYMDERFEEIIDFAELWDFVDVPIKNYSSGMIARLGFSIATQIAADILIVDEVLSVGDMAFQKKCHRKMDDLLADGKTLLFVSHSDQDVRKMCSRAVWLENGMIKADGDVNNVCDEYIKKQMLLG